MRIWIAVDRSESRKIKGLHKHVETKTALEAVQ